MCHLYESSRGGYTCQDDLCCCQLMWLSLDEKQPDVLPTPVQVARQPARMLTPCNHFFHVKCLQRWMDVRMECPICRRLLPPP